ncbi:family 16 glycoside hydrolase [Candidatus Nitrosocosmicus sp. T]
MYIILTHKEVKSTDKFCDFEMEFDINTLKQLRQNYQPDVWEVGWLEFRYVDRFHHYSLLFKPNRLELGKKDCDTCTDPVDGQKFLVKKSTPTLKLNTWDKINVLMTDNHIKVYVNNNVVIDSVNKGMTPKLASDSIAMYSEDAYVSYNNMIVSPK